MKSIINRTFYLGIGSKYRLAQESEMVRGGFKTVQIRLDADVIEWLKQDGAGYQTRANAILRQAMLQAD